MPEPGSRPSPTPDRTAPGPGGPALVAVLCLADLVREHFERIIRSADDLQLWRPEAGRDPKAVLVLAGSGGGLRTLRQSPHLNPWPRAALFDLDGVFRALGAGLHGFRGYLPPEVSEERLLRCLRRVADGEIDAPRPHYETLLRVLTDPPLDDRDRNILRLLAVGRTNMQIVREARIGERNLGNRLTFLETLFEAEDRTHLAAIAAALGFGWPYEDGPPQGVLVETPKRGRQPKS